MDNLRQLVLAGAKQKQLSINDKILDRLNYELKVIEGIGGSKYFIILSKLVNLCNNLNILRSCGRGSAANSLVNYCLDITKIDPLIENLVFEKFIHLGSSVVIDIDIDVPKGFKDKIIDAFRKLHPEYNIYRLAFTSLTENDYEDVFDGENHYKIHPTAIIIVDNETDLYSFRYRDKDYCISFDLLNDLISKNRFDIVELEYLNRLQQIAANLPMENHPYTVPLNDNKVFEFFHNEDIQNIFQFNSPNLKLIFSRFKPGSIRDLSIINAMFRPGLSDFISIVIANKNSRELIFNWTDERLNNILKQTYGLLIYQESLLHILNVIAGMSLIDAETWRRILMQPRYNHKGREFSQKFKQSCKINSNLNESEIDKLNDLIIRFVRLTFQKSHSFSYATIGYWGAYYNTYFPVEFQLAFNKNNNFQKFEFHK